MMVLPGIVKTVKVFVVIVLLMIAGFMFVSCEGLEGLGLDCDCGLGIVCDCDATCACEFGFGCHCDDDFGDGDDPWYTIA